MLHLEKATLDHAYYLSPRLREADILELTAVGSSPIKALVEGVMYSEPALAGVNQHGECVVMFGACTNEPSISASLWMLSSNDIFKHHIQFLRESRKFLDAFNDKWPVLFNVCDVRNGAHVRWMKWLDYVFINKHGEYGLEKRPFYEFVRLRKN